MVGNGKKHGIGIWLAHVSVLSCRITLTLHVLLQELVASTPNVRNWRGMLIALLVIVAVLGLILFSIFLLSPPDQGPRVNGDKFTIDHITSSLFKITPFNGSWVSGKERGNHLNQMYLVIFCEQQKKLDLFSWQYLSIYLFFLNKIVSPFRWISVHCSVNEFTLNNESRVVQL